MEKQDYLKMILLILIIFFSLARFINIESTIGPYYQQSVNSYISLKIAQGDIPYKDFKFSYTPVSHYIIAFLMNIFGQHLIVSAIFSNIMAIASIYLVYLIGNLHHKKIGLVAAFLTSIAPNFVENGYYLETVGTTFFLLSIYLIFKYKDKTLPIFLAGILISVSYFIKQTLGIFMIATIIFLLLYKKKKQIIPYLSGQFLFIVLISSYLYYKTSSFEFIVRMTYMLHSTLQKSILPKTYILIRDLGTPFYILAIALAFYFLYSRFIKKEFKNPILIFLSIAILLTILYFIPIKVYDRYYFIPLVPLFALLVSKLIYCLSWKNLKEYKAIHILIILIILQTLLTGGVTAISRQIYYQPPIHNQVKEVGTYINTITKDGDNVFIDDSSTLFYTEREKTGKYYVTGGMINTGILTKNEILTSIETELPSVIAISDTRLEWLEQEERFWRLYKLNTTLNGYKIYVLN